MTRYEIVAHLTVESDGSTPEEAAEVFKRDLLARSDGTVTLRDLALWRPTDGSTPTPLPDPLPRQLTDFFAGVARCAAIEEATFRARVAEIFGEMPLSSIAQRLEP